MQALRAPLPLTHSAGMLQLSTSHDRCPPISSTSSSYERSIHLREEVEMEVGVEVGWRWKERCRHKEGEPTG